MSKPKFPSDSLGHAVNEDDRIMATTVVDFLSLSEAAKLIPGRPHTSTLARWHNRGVNGTHLRCRRSGNRLYTKREWIDLFLNESLRQNF